MVNRSIASQSFVALAFVVVVTLFATPVAAHTDFDSSTPAEGDVVDDFVSEIVIRFTGAVTPAGDGFTLLDPDSVLRSPVSVTTEDDKVFVLEFDPPLAGGSVGVRWMVESQDAHVIEGAFSFTVIVPPPATSTTTEPATSPTMTTATLGEDADASGVSLEEFLTAESSILGQGRQLAGRVASFLGLIGSLGGLAFVAFTFRGARREIEGVLAAVVGLSILAAVGGGVEYWGWLAQSGGTFSDEMTSTPGLAMTLRVVGGILLAATVTAARWFTSGANWKQWDPRTATVALPAASLLVVSFWFDGHTVSEGSRVVHALVNSVHVVAAAVWVGGVIALLAVLIGRQRRNEPARAAELVMRFSSIATVALIAVALGGVVMATLVLDSLGELTSTDWGQLLLVKIAAVGTAASGGAYNHFYLRPQLQTAHEGSRLETKLRSTLIAEALVLIFVVAITAWLVAASTGIPSALSD